MSDEDTEDEALGTIAGGAAWVLGGRITKLALLFGIQVFMARLLDPSSYGGVIIGSMVISIGAMIGALGLPGGMSRKIAYYEDTPAKTRGAFWTGLLIGTTSGVCLAIGGYVAAPVLATQVFNSVELVPILRIAAVAIPFTILTQISLSIAKASRDAKPHVIIKQLLKPITKTLFVAIFISGLGFGAVGAMSGVALSMVVGGIGAGYLAYRALRVPVLGETEMMYTEVLTFSLPLLFASAASFFISNTDTILIGAFLSTSAVSNYDVAFKLQQLGTVFFFPATFLLPPIITRFQKGEQLSEAKAVYQVVTKWMTAVSLPLFLAIFLFPEIIIQFTFGQKYLSGSTALRTLSVAILVTVAMGANGASLIALGHNRINLYVNSAMASLNIILNIVLIPTIGILGAAVASTIAFVGRDILFSIFLYRWYAIHPFSQSMLKPLTAVAITTPFVYALLQVFAPTNLLTIMAFCIAVVVLYFPLMIRFGAVDARDIRVFNHLESSVAVDLEIVRKTIRRLQT